MVAPSYELTRTDAINGVATAPVNNVGTALSNIDSALDKVSTTANKGFNISADNGVTSQNIAPGATAKFASSNNNVQVTRTGDTINVGMLNNPTFSGLVTANGGLTVGAGQAINMGGNKVTNVAAGTVASDAVNKGQLDAVSTNANRYVKINGLSNGSDDAAASPNPGNIAIGAGSATGNGASAYNPTPYNNAIAIGYNAKASAGSGAIALGDTASATHTNIAIGAGADASGTTRTAVALGIGSKVTGWNSVALGGSSVADRDNTVSVGSAGSQRQVGNVAAGTAPTDAVNKGQLDAANRYFKTSGANDGTDDAAAVGNGVAIGPKAVATFSGLTNAAVAVGASAQAFSQNSTAIGSAATASQAYATAIGSLSTASGMQSVAIGIGAKATNISSTAIGNSASATGLYGYALGQQANAAGDRSVAIGSAATVDANAASSVAIGRASYTMANNAVALGQGSLANRANTISVGTAAPFSYTSLSGAALTLTPQTRQIVNVGAGTENTDAVNVSQLKTVVDALGGGAAIEPATGAVTGPSYTVNNIDGSTSTSTTVGGAVTDLNTNITNLSQQLNDGTVGLVQQAAPGANLTVGKATDGAAVDFAGTTGTRKLQSVTAGVVATDAVNVGQLTAALGGTVNGDGTVTPPSYDVHNEDGTAGTTAETNVGGAITNLDNRVYTNTTDIDQLQQDALQWNATVGAYDASHGSGTAQKIANVAAGAVTGTSTEAVNGSQLHAATSATAAALGTDVDTDGNLVAPDYTVTTTDANGVETGSTTVHSVGEAVENLDGRISQNTAAIGTINTTLDGLDDTLADAVMYDSAMHDKVTLGRTGTQVTLTNVKAGALTDTSTDAVNGSQLYSTNQSVAQNTADIGALDGRVDQNTTDIGTINTTLDGMDDTLADAVMYDSAMHDKVTLGRAGTQVTLTNVKAGALTDTSTDAVNGSQLYSTNQSVAQNTADIGALDDRVDVAEGNISTLTTTVNNISNGTIGLVQYDADNGVVTVAADKAGTAVDFAGTTGTRKLQSVTAGVVATDAVNVGQLTAALGGTVNGDGTVTPPSYDVHNEDGTAGTTAETNVGGAITNLDNRVYANTTDIDQLQQDALQWNATVGAYDASHGSGTAQKIANVAAGAVTGTSTEAVNGSQLYATDQRVQQQGSSTAAALGSSYDATTGAVAAPSYTLAKANTLGGTTGAATDVGTGFAKVDGALGNLDTRTTANTTDIRTINTTISTIDGRVTTVEGSVSNLATQIDNGEVGLVKYDAASGTVSVAADKAGTTVDLRNNGGVARRLKGVAAGAQDEDAVNLAQLKNSLGGDARYDATTGEYLGPTYTVTNADGSTTTVNNVGGAITNIDKRVYDNTTQISNLSQQIGSGTVGLVQQSAPGAKLTVGKDTGGDEVDVRKAGGGERKLTGVADGTVAEGSKDAVNGGQLYGASKSVADALGGGSVVNPDGTVSKPAYTVTNADGTTSKVSGVEGAVSNLDQRVHNNTTAIANNTTQINNLTTQISNGEVGLVKQDATTRAITVAKDTDGTAVNFAGTAGDRTLTGVAAAKADNDAVNLGQLKSAGVIGANGESRSVVTYDNSSKTSITMGEAGNGPVVIHNVAQGTANTDAVNVAQLNDRLQHSSTETLSQANAYTDQRIDDVWGGMNKVVDELGRQDQRISRMGAMNAAMMTMSSSLAGVRRDNRVGAGMGYNNGQAALSVGYQRAFKEGKATLTIGGSFTSEDQSVGVGGGFGW